jgi:hypothetical protein
MARKMRLEGNKKDESTYWIRPSGFGYHLYSVPRSCVEDEGGPLGAGLQEQASNHLKLLWPKAMVVSVEEKSRLKIVAGRTQRDERKRTIR